MTVLRIVANLEADNPRAAIAFYRDLLGLDIVMEHGWILTFGSDARMTVQVSIASEGGAGTPVPDISVEVDDVDAIYERARDLALPIVYAITDEAWGVRRFFVRDPLGKVVNILTHAG